MEPDQMELDHVAIATTDAGPIIATLVTELGATVMYGGHNAGFRPMQLRVGDVDRGMTVEILEPWDTEKNDFLARFLARHGAGPHHMTFKVHGIEQHLERLQAAGYTPASVNFSNPMWKEMFLQPRETFGTVIQLAEMGAELWSRDEAIRTAMTEGPGGTPMWWPTPPPRGDQTAYLERIVLHVPELAPAREFFGGVLRGEVTDADSGSVDLLWPTSGARVRLEQRAGAAGVDRYDVDAGGNAREIEMAGARFVCS
ncbi:MAG: Glyoxalase/Bleomycin resistance protein/Dioxygenase superfamily [Actinomycetia bacterium]|nr:Glyoxalase/Bleomycin resistance protein/Dioxygenase superfamily [Actinomycetes bacterium]